MNHTNPITRRMVSLTPVLVWMFAQATTVSGQVLTPTNHLPTVVLLGDSIRLGYQATVQEELRGQATVWGPEDNGRTTRYTLRTLAAWLKDQHPDVVHVNCGLWDVARRDDELRPRADLNVVLEEYTENMRQIIKTIRATTQARFIWATTTPVDEARHREHRKFDRLNRDIAAFNAAAVAVAQETDVAVDDLSRVVETAGPEQYWTEDGVHYTPEGSALLGHAVADAVRKVLAKEQGR